MKHNVIEDNLQLFSNYSDLISAIKKDKKHPIYYILNNQTLSLNLSRNLQILEKKCLEFNRIKKKIIDKSNNDDNNFFSLLSEIDILAYYYKKFETNNVIYEPPYHVVNKLDARKSTREPKIDIKLIVEPSEYNIEIFTILETPVDRKRNEVDGEIFKRLKAATELEKVRYCLSLEFTENHIDRFFDRIRELISNRSREGDFKDQDKELASVKLDYKENIFQTNKTPLIIGSFKEATINNSASRLKNKIKDKIDKQIQYLPKEDNNILIINLSHISSNVDLEDIENAIFGHSYTTFDLKTYEQKHFRQENGVQHHGKWSWVSMIITYTGYNYHEKYNRKYFLNSGRPEMKELYQKLLLDLSNFI